MSRLTKKNDNGYYECVDEVMTWEGGIRQTQIIGRYEDIEEEIGCPLEVVWKATNNGFYTIGGKHFTNYMNDKTREECSIVFRPMKYDNEIVAIVGKNEIGASDTWYEYSTKDYKKTWWLKENCEE